MKLLIVSREAVGSGGTGLLLSGDAAGIVRVGVAERPCAPPLLRKGTPCCPGTVAAWFWMAAKLRFLVLVATSGYLVASEVI